MLAVGVLGCIFCLFVFTDGGGVGGFILSMVIFIFQSNFPGVFYY